MIDVDDRVGSKELMDYLQGVARLVRLDAADAAFMGNGPDSPISIGIERKTLRDLINSLMSGRLCGVQLPKMRNHYNVVYLLVEGAWALGDQSGKIVVLESWGAHDYFDMGNGKHVQAKWLWKWLNTLSIMADVHIVQTNALCESADWIYAMYQWWQKPFSDHHGHEAVKHQKFAKASIYRPNLARRVAAELPGVGIKRSADVAAHFGNVAAMVNADEAEWQKIDGIGTTIAESVVRSVKGG